MFVNESQKINTILTRLRTKITNLKKNIEKMSDEDEEKKNQ